jgi:hypothetical protein
MTAFITAEQDSMAPTSPAPFTPVGLCWQRTLRVSKAMAGTSSGEQCERQGDAERFGSVSLFLQCQPQAGYGFFGSRLMGPAVGLLVLSLN